MILKPILVSLLISFFVFRPVLAYIDPGTAGMVVGGIWPIIVGFLALISAFIVKNFIDPIKEGLRLLWRKIKGEQKKKSKKKSRQKK